MAMGLSRSRHKSFSIWAGETVSENVYRSIGRCTDVIMSGLFRFDYNNFLGPCSVQFQKHTRNHQVIMDEWTKYTSEYVGNTGERAVVKGKIALNKRAPVKLSLNKFGEPVILQSNIPTISTAGTLETMKGVLRAFLSGHYSMDLNASIDI